MEYKLKGRIIVIEKLKQFTTKSFAVMLIALYVFGKVEIMYDANIQKSFIKHGAWWKS